MNSIVSFLSRKTRLVLVAEQGIVSLASIAVTIGLARTMSPEDWGIYSFAFAAMLVAQGFQRNIVTLPLITFCPDTQKLQAQKGQWFRMNRLVMAACCAVMGLSALVAHLSGSGWVARSMLCTCALIVPAFAHEFLRRVYIQQGKAPALLLASSLYAVTNLLVVLGVWLSGRLQAEIVAVALCLSLVPLHLALRRVAPSADSTKPGFDPAWLKEVRRMAAPGAAAGIAYAGYNFAIQGILGALSGPAAVGALNAARTLSQPVSVLISALESHDKPAASRAFATGGVAGLWNSQTRSLLRTLALGLPYLAVLLLFTTDMERLLLGAAYPDLESLIRWWAVGGLALMIGVPSDTALYIQRRTDVLLAGRIVAAVTACAAGYLLIPTQGASGAVQAMLIGWVIASLSGWAHLKHRLQAGNKSAVIHGS